MLNKTDELKDRVEARKHELLSRFNDLKADSRADAAGERDRIKSKLDELEGSLKDGWDRVSDAVASKLNDWLKN
jgi:hypothetical protein